MSAERQRFYEKPFIKEALIFIGVLVVAGVSITTINYALSMT